MVVVAVAPHRGASSGGAGGGEGDGALLLRYREPERLLLLWFVGESLRRG